METLFICGDAELSQDDKTILVKTAGIKKRIAIESIHHIVLLSDDTLTTKFLSLCGTAGVRVSVFDYYGWWKGSFEPASSVGSGEIKLRQAKLVLDTSRRMAVAKEIISAAISNIIENLRYHAYRGAELLKQPIRFIVAQKDKIPTIADTETLMGLEGVSRKAYYEAWPAIDLDLAFAPRVKRPPNNRINCLLSYLNGMTYAAVRHEIAKTLLDETLSVLNAPSSSRSSLSLDLSEPFKPIIVDRLIFKMVRKNMVCDNWFDERDGVCLLTEAGRRAVVEQFAHHIDKVSGERSLRSHMRQTALSLQRHILDIEEFDAYRVKR